MGAAGAQPQSEDSTFTKSMRVAPERLIAFQRLVARDGITAVVNALERERVEREAGIKL